MFGFGKSKKKKEDKAEPTNKVENTNDITISSTSEAKEIEIDDVQATVEEIEDNDIDEDEVEDIEDDIDEVEDIEDDIDEVEDIEDDIDEVEDIEDDIDEVEDIEDNDELESGGFEEVESSPNLVVKNVQNIALQANSSSAHNISTENIKKSMEANNNGIRFKKKKDYKQALEMYNQAIFFYPGYAMAYYNRAILYSKQQQFDKAIDDYSTAISINPKAPEFYNNRGNLFFEAKDFAKADKDYATSLNLAPNYSEAYHNRAMLYFCQEKLQLALQNFTRAIELNSDLSINYYNIACIYSRLNQKDQALDFLEKSFRKGFFDRGKLTTDKDLDNIRDLPAFQDLAERGSSMSPYTMAMKKIPK